MNWLEELKEKYFSGVSNVFMITGNIGDYIFPGKSLQTVLESVFKNDFKMKRALVFDFVSSQELFQNEEQKEALSLHDFKDAKYEKTALIIKYPDVFLGENASVIENDRELLICFADLVASQEFSMSDNLVVFVAESSKGIHPLLLSSTSKMTCLNVPYPDSNERQGMLNYLKAHSQENTKFEVDDDQFVRLTAGLSLGNIEDIFLQAEYQGVLKRDFIVRKKEELMQKQFGDIIEIFDTDNLSLDDFAGADKVKSFHQECVINPLLVGKVDYIPKGILYSGPPGTGKTYFAKCLAGSSGINFIEFKISKILDKWVGVAEQRLEKAFNCFEALAPVGVFIDEVDQALSRGENDGNSVSKNLFGMFLAFLSKPEHRGKIIFIGATNYPNKLDEAFKRAGRFDKKIPFLLPNHDERKAAFKIYLNKNNIRYDSNLDFDLLAQKSDKYSQAEIENVIVKTLELMQRKNLEVATTDILLKSLQFMVHRGGDKINEMIQIALDECNDLEFVPEEYWNRMN